MTRGALSFLIGWVIGTSLGALVGLLLAFRPWKRGRSGE